MSQHRDAPPKIEFRKGVARVYHLHSVKRVVSFRHEKTMMFFVGCFCLLFAPFTLVNHFLRFTLGNWMVGILSALFCLIVGVAVMPGSYGGITNEAVTYYIGYCDAVILLVIAGRGVFLVRNRMV